MKTMRGFTLLELLIVLAIMAILAGWGVPSMRQMTVSNRLTTNANNLAYAFQLARSEAITRSRPIDVVAAAGGWAQGWNVMDGTSIIKSWGVMAGSPNINASTTSYEYNAQGRLNASNTITLCDPASNSGRKVDFSLIGRVTVSTVTLSNTTTCN